MLFHPRNDVWSEHFERNGDVLRDLTSTGRATIDVLQINDPDAIRVRDVLIEVGRFEG